MDIDVYILNCIYLIGWVVDWRELSNGDPLLCAFFMFHFMSIAFAFHSPTFCSYKLSKPKSTTRHFIKRNKRNHDTERSIANERNKKKIFQKKN